MKTSTHLLMSLVACAALAACGTDIQYMELNPPPHSMTARDPESVEMFTTQKPEKHYVEVGQIRSSLASVASNSNADDLLRALRGEAARRGCDGVVLTGRDRVASASSMAVVEGTLGYSGICIVYNE